ncbi:hypothetical protein HanIR_Chr07g0318521 [Helianthus annuus]|nr:hypothetical protein HanIR_Chr07g0318521 [Helianthus annuus]
MTSLCLMDYFCNTLVVFNMSITADVRSYCILNNNYFKELPLFKNKNERYKIGLKLQMRTKVPCKKFTIK